MRMVLFLATTLLLILLMSPEVTSQSDCYIKSNGCSVPFGLPFFYKKTFTPACVKHDVCYSCVRFGMSLLICVIFISSNRTILVRFGCISGEFGRAMFVFQRDMVGPKYPWRDRAWYAIEGCQIGTVSYLLWPSSTKWAWWYRSHIRSVTWCHIKYCRKLGQ